MSDGSERNGSPPWIDDRCERDTGEPGAREVEVMARLDSDAIPFVSNRPELAGTTTAWISADADVVVTSVR